ncbi:membrane protein [Polymorphobacter glacialis]|uniref:Protoporphyrinogen IX oxidase n=1 Tax=Sandarakinorhabdus glacialis TaxID=1614636 RepID=A0A916ZQK7_9SPHN|nr:CopD family protein [Polymorphobacter glacialis]GGE09491.1 membrane protein [Polymorphobacter glacialis]
MIEFGTGWLGDGYLWVKSLHVIFVIFWMAGMFMLPRFLVYWSQLPADSPENAVWTDRCNRLRRIILTPGITIVWLAGIALGFHLGWPLWLWAKLVVVLGLSGFHGWMIGAARKFAAGDRPYTEKTLRLANEIPSLATIAIVILVIVKPF